MNQAARKMVILRVTHIHNGDGHARLRGHPAASIVPVATLLAEQRANVIQLDS